MGIFELSAEDEMKANAAAGSTLAALFRGGASVWSALGKTVKFTTDYTALGLRKTADFVEYGGNATADFCNERSLSCKKKSMEYDGVDEAEIEAAIERINAQLYGTETETKAETHKFKPAEKDGGDEGRDGRAPVSCMMEPGLA